MKSRTELVDFLQDPRSYPDDSKEVERKETHISEVYLTRRWAYKIKKPLTLPFLDYSTLELRREACEAELELNRRFSHDIYQDLVAITESAEGVLAWNGSGPAREYAVRMRRIADADLMDQRLQQGPLSQADKDRLVSHLVHCYAAAPRESREPSVHWQGLKSLVAENRISLYELALHLGQDPKPWLALSSRQSLYLHAFRHRIETRVRQGKLIEGHGDLRPEHIVFENEVSLIDGIEFNRNLRILDQADELSFLGTECTVMGHEDLGRELRQRVLDQLQDTVFEDLLAFYESYRALVRAKVNLLKAEQLNEAKRKPEEEKIMAQVAAYRDLATRRMTRAIPAFTFLVAGAMGSGKTTLAKALKQDLGAEHLESDRLRQELLGRSEKAAAFGQGRYTKESRLGIYQTLRDRMLELGRDDLSVIVDASFSDPAYVSCIVEALQREERPFLIIVCECSDKEALRRIEQRMRTASSPSEARPELYQEQKRLGDWSFRGLPQCRVNTELPLDQQLQQVYQEVAASLES